MVMKMPYQQAGEFGPPPANMKKIPGLPGGGRNAAGGMNPALLAEARGAGAIGIVT